MSAKKVIILGAAGRDFHTFNVLFRDNPDYEVVAFTATQIPFIANRIYPRELSGKLYKNGIKIHDVKELPSLIKRLHADVCIQAYSDVSYENVMHNASIANANGADFWIVAPQDTMLKSRKPVIAVCAVRTGCGKSQTSRYIAKLLRKMGKRVVVVRHPMPYGDLKEQAVQRFATLDDLDKYKTTIEEREDYEPHVRNGFIVYAGVDYERILKSAEGESDVIIFDGGNNDAPFYKPDLLITVADPLRAGDELTYYPGETVARLADVLLINKVNSATKVEINQVIENLRSLNKRAKVIRAESEILSDNHGIVRGKRALIIEDGPSITHGGMKIGAGTIAAKMYGVSAIVPAKRYAVGTIKMVFEKYPRLYNELPAMGYSRREIRDLETTINRAKCDVVISATPTDLTRILNVSKPILQVFYELRPLGKEFDDIIKEFSSSH